jgi:lipopolysaccharide/colanic/teichoic acid biosynthesis glycosyltransferase
MSFIGPRPERPEMIAGLEKAIPRFRQRLLVRPGLTGLAQVQLPPDTDLESVRLKLAHDLCYLEHLSFLLDCRIFVATIFVVLGLPLHVTRLIFVLPGGTMVAKWYDQPARKTVLVPNFQPV